jgi:MinD-like ATPase involved in chromosome partitioning or flagellar assembly/tetratricopeptide (TPR) repeat protein
MSGTAENRAGQIITFYSYKGGSGRSMALANVACLLAQDQQRGSAGRVLMIDWDLEAPGLHRFFAPYASDGGLGDANPGLIDLFLDLVERTKELPATVDEPADESWSSGFRLEDYVLDTGIPNLSLMKAGRTTSDYGRRVTSFDWAGMYERSPWLLSWFTNQITHQYLYTLIDSRTGETDTSGICTAMMPEQLVTVFTPSQQAINGVLREVEKAVKYRRRSADERPIRVLPLPSRIEHARPELRERWRFAPNVGYQSLFEGLFRELFGLTLCNLTDYFGEVQVPQNADYAYGELIAVLQERSQDKFTLSGSYLSLLHRLLDPREIWEGATTTTTRHVERSVIAPAANIRRDEWADHAALLDRIQVAAQEFDWSALEAVCNEMIQRVAGTGEVPPVQLSRAVVRSFRRSKKFELALRFSEALVQAGDTSAPVLREYARSLMDAGSLSAAVTILERLVEAPDADAAEAFALLGMAHKRLYLSQSGAASERSRRALTQSIQSYATALSLREDFDWPAINIAGLLIRAERDGIAIQGYGDPRELAKRVLAHLPPADQRMPWHETDALEAALALDDTHAAVAAARRYVDTTNIDLVEIEGTLRQLVDVWQLNPKNPPGDSILPILQAKLLTLSGSSVSLAEMSTVPVASGPLAVDPGPITLESIAWWQTGLNRSRAVATIETSTGSILGSGFLVRIPTLSAQPLLLTANHMVSAGASVAGSVDPDYIVVNLTLMERILKPRSLVWSSDVLDATLLDFEEDLSALQAIPVATALPPMGSNQRVHVIGISATPELSISVNLLADYNQTVLHYRSAGKLPGSGGPILNDSWKVIGMHHGGGTNIPRLTGTGTYDALEGTRMKAILDMIASSKPTAT